MVQEAVSSSEGKAHLTMAPFSLTGILRCRRTVHQVCLEFSLDGAVLSGQTGLPGLVVVNLGDSEKIVQWNQQHRHQRLEVGHVVLEVNGISEPRRMLQEFHTAKSVKMLIKRGRSAEQQKIFELALRRCHMEQAVDGILEKVPPGDIEAGETCSICHDSLEECEGCGGEKSALAATAVTKLPCGHHFHRACVKKWLVSGQPRCPLCNHDCCKQKEGENQQGGRL